VPRDWENTFQSWGKPPGETETTKCEHAETAIRKAIQASDALANRSVEVFAQGSYRNRTNVRQDSDVDICVLCRDAFYFDLPDGKRREQFGLTTEGNYSYHTYKNDVEAALRSYFGSSGVTRGNKAFDIHENTYRVDADAVPAFEYRLYDQPSSYREGTRFFPDNGGSVTNWPTQNYENGVTKNDATGRRFKAVVRIMKRLRNEMADEGIGVATPIPSFLIECIVWNVPNEGFGHDTYAADVRYTIAHLWTQTQSADTCREWSEINKVKYLFHPTQPWTVGQVHAFLDGAWQYVGFK
jgi:hypothetical protein